MTNHLYDGLLANASGERLFATIPGAKPRYYSYQHVSDVSAKLANQLVALGVRPGDRVAAQIPKSIEALMLYLATVRAGAVFLPLNTAYTAHEVSYFVEDATPRVFICDPKDTAAYSDMAARLGSRLETMGVWQSPDEDAGSFLADPDGWSNEFETVPRGQDDLAAILYTSGTTGRSKGAMLTHGNLLSNARTLVELWQFTQDDVLLHALPVFHTHGLFVATNVLTLAGGSLIFLPGFSNDTILEHMPKSTCLMGVPTFYTRLLDDERFTREAAKDMRLFISGSAPLLAETHAAFERRTGQRILERYGMTETNMNTSNPYDGDRRAGTVGPALPGVDVRICDDNGEELKRGDVGMLEVRGPNVFNGYWNMPEKTAEELRPDGWFITGDLATMAEDGYVTIVGRGNDLIISGGYNIYPKEVELVIDEQLGVRESSVIGVPHPDFGEGVVAVIVVDTQPFDVELLQRSLGEKLARFKQPKRIVILDELPRNTMGKVQKNVLRESYKDSFA
ncbi:MAG: malonyl-CoA synthase [Ahrensia sp.]|nr:malonyl-CoA synthase [Ahrensia sp.]